MASCLIALGCNQGPCRQHIEFALEQLGQLPDSQVVRTSSLRQTRPVGQADWTFLNGAAVLKTALAAPDLMEHLLQLEARAGRDRTRDAGNRPLDLDILLYDNLSLSTSGLTIPHPRMSFRRFVLEPAAEIASDWQHPLLKADIGQLLSHLNRQPNVVSVIASPDSIRNVLEQKQRGPSVRWQHLSCPADLDEATITRDTQGDHWVVLLTSQQDAYPAIAPVTKLFITCQPGGVVDRWQGPLWDVSKEPQESDTDPAAILVDQVMTAIASMQPVNGAGERDALSSG